MGDFQDVFKRLLRLIVIEIPTEDFKKFFISILLAQGRTDDQRRQEYLAVFFIVVIFNLNIYLKHIKKKSKGEDNEKGCSKSGDKGGKSSSKGLSSSSESDSESIQDDEEIPEEPGNESEGEGGQEGFVEEEEENDN